MIYSQRFLDYHAENNHVYDAFEKFTLEAIRAGRSKLSANLIYERIRWDSMIYSKDQYKMNNNYRADHARMFVEKYPNYRDFFSTRERKTKDLIAK